MISFHCFVPYAGLSRLPSGGENLWQQIRMHSPTDPPAQARRRANPSKQTKPAIAGEIRNLHKGIEPKIYVFGSKLIKMHFDILYAILIVLAASLQRQGAVAHWPSCSSCMLTAILQTGHLLELIYQICFIRHLVGLVFVMRLS